SRSAACPPRNTEPVYRRVVRLCLTAAGHEALDRADAAYGRWLGQVLAETGEPHLVLHALDLLNQAMDDLRCSGSATAARRPAPADPPGGRRGAPRAGS